MNTYNSDTYAALRSTARQRDPATVFIGYHDACVDGFSSAWACWRFFGDAATYQSLKYGMKSDHFSALLEAVIGKHVYLVDFSFPAERVLRLCEIAASVTILDHHETFKHILDELTEQHANRFRENLSAVFEMDDCGASLCWKVFHGSPLPRLLRYVRDRDLWIKELPFTEEVSAALAHTRFDFATWDALDLRSLTHDGSVLLKATKRSIDYFVEHRHRVTVCMDGVEYNGTAVNAPHYLASDLAVACYRRSEVGFGIVYATRPLNAEQFEVFYSIRVADDCDFNASEFCGRFGGGGHVRAAGMKLISSSCDLAKTLMYLQAPENPNGNS